MVCVATRFVVNRNILGDAWGLVTTSLRTSLQLTQDKNPQSLLLSFCVILLAVLFVCGKGKDDIWRSKTCKNWTDHTLHEHDLFVLSLNLCVFAGFRKICDLFVFPCFFFWIVWSNGRLCSAESPDTTALLQARVDTNGHQMTHQRRWRHKKPYFYG